MVQLDEYVWGRGCKPEIRLWRWAGPSIKGLAYCAREYVFAKDRKA